MSDRSALRLARAYRLVAWSLEGGLYLVLAASVAAFGAVHPWAYLRLWQATGVLAALLFLRGALAGRLSRRLGSGWFALAPGGRRLVVSTGDLDPAAAEGLVRWRLTQTRGPLLAPGLAACAMVVLQLLPLWPPAPGGVGSWQPLTVSAPETGRGLVFLLVMVALHAVGATVLGQSAARRRFVRFATWLGLALTVVALVGKASGTRLVYGFFQPLETSGSMIMGPFINHNHFAGYMLMVAPLALGACLSRFDGYWRRVGERRSLRRLLLVLQEPEGTALLYALLPALAAVVGLVASESRGGLLAFLGAVTVVATVHGKRLRRALLAPLLLVALAVAWFGPERVGGRFARSPEAVPQRTTIWLRALDGMDGFWLTGSGFNTFSTAITRASAWRLPRGASPWREGDEARVAATPGAGFLYLGEPGRWFREAHNDYVQVLVELGLPGLLLVGWALVALLRRVWRDPALLAAVAGIALHSLVDFDLQIPAVAALFVVVAAAPPRVSRREVREAVGAAD